MKTAISIPDETFRRVEESAHELGLSRSEFYARAAERYLAELDADSITRQMDAALDADSGTDESTNFAREASRTLLSGIDDDW